MRSIESVDTDMEVWVMPAKTAKSCLKPILASLVMVLVSACGSDYHRLDGNQFIPKNLDLIEKSLARDFYPEMDFSQIKFYALSPEVAKGECDSYVGLCSFAEEQVVILINDDDDSINYCPYIMHELMHQLLKQKYNDSDHDHKRPEFHHDDTATQFFLYRCMEIGALPMSIFYQPTDLKGK